MVEADHGGVETSGGLAQIVGVRRLGDLPAQDEGSPRLGREQVQIGDHSQHLVAGRENGHVTDAVVEHRKGQLVGRLVGAHGEDRGGHNLA